VHFLKSEALAGLGSNFGILRDQLADSSLRARNLSTRCLPPSSTTETDRRIRSNCAAVLDLDLRQHDQAKSLCRVDRGLP
jgi:hypothetical protein